jgi:hypothetical protein
MFDRKADLKNPYGRKKAGLSSDAVQRRKPRDASLHYGQKHGKIQTPP